MPLFGVCVVSFASVYSAPHPFLKGSVQNCPQTNSSRIKLIRCQVPSLPPWYSRSAGSALPAAARCFHPAAAADGCAPGAGLGATGAAGGVGGEGAGGRGPPGAAPVPEGPVHLPQLPGLAGGLRMCCEGCCRSGPLEAPSLPPPIPMLPLPPLLHPCARGSPGGGQRRRWRAGPGPKRRGRRPSGASGMRWPRQRSRPPLAPAQSQGGRRGPLGESCMGWAIWRKAAPGIHASGARAPALGLLSGPQNSLELVAAPPGVLGCFGAGGP
jgi:hypothetical protein